jgi:hypothetical protein
MFTYAERNLFDDGINQASSVKRYITVMSNGSDVSLYNFGESKL